MLKMQIDGVFECDVDTFWNDFYFLEEYGRSVYVDGMGFKGWRLESLKDDGDKLSRRVVLDKAIPSEIPRAVRKLLGESSRFFEDGVFDRRSGVYTFTLTPERFQLNGYLRGTVRVEPHPQGCLRRVELEADVTLLGMGKLLERNMLDTVSGGYRDGVQYANAFLRARKAARSEDRTTVVPGQTQPRL